MSSITGKTIDIIQGKSLKLRRTRPEDAELLYREMYSNRRFMTAVRPNDHIDSATTLAERIRKQNAVPLRDCRYLEYMVVHREHGPIGWLAIADYEPLHRRAEYLFGIFREEHQQARHVVEAALLSHALAFNTLGVHRLTAQVFTHNTLAQKSLESAGYRHEGTLHEHLYSGLSDRYLDVHHYGFTAAQFRNNPRLARVAKGLFGHDITQPAHAPGNTPARKPSPIRTAGGRRAAPRRLQARRKLLPLAVAATLAASAPAMADNFVVNQPTDTADDTATGTLSWAIRQANTTAGADTITLENDVVIDALMKNFIDSDVTINGNGYAIYGSDPGGSDATMYRPLFVKSGNVTLSDMTIGGGKAAGGSSFKGGGGAGLGGALFIYDGNVTTRNVTFDSNRAAGGNSGVGSYSSGYGGGAMTGAALTLTGNGEYHGGGGMFASSTGKDGAYGGNGNYGGFAGFSDAADGSMNGGFAGGGALRVGETTGGIGGFGGGGGANVDAAGYTGGKGGFGGGGGASYVGGGGGFGGGGAAGNASGTPGSGGYGAGDGAAGGSGGGGAGMGGAVFIGSGTLKMVNTAFTDNGATGGTGANDGQGIGGALFVCNSEDSNCSATVSSDSCGVTFSGNTADSDVNAHGDIGTATDPCSDAPYATNVAVSGTPVVGETLSGSYVYTDDDGNTESGTSYQWYRADDDTGTNQQAIAGATTQSYTLTSSDLDKYIFFEVTPRTDVENTTGDPVMSAQPAGPVTDGTTDGGGDDSTDDSSSDGGGGGGSSQLGWLAALLAMRFWRRRR